MQKPQALIFVRMRKKLLVFSLLVTGLVASCSKDFMNEAPAPNQPRLPAQPYDYQAELNFPAHFNTLPLSFLNSTPADNPVTNAGATLGRVLFYDRQLSLNRSTSCGSCHLQEKAFSDPRPFSNGFNGGFTGRNAMAISNTRFSSRYFWDLRAHSVEQQVLMPLYNSVEMGMDSATLVLRVRKAMYYAPLLQNAFGDTAVTELRIRKALAQFVRSLNTFRSKYDQGVANNFAEFSQLERDGLDYFMNGQFNCNHCHSSQNFYERTPLNNGLDALPVDSGVYVITGDPNDIGKFKVPTLRNVALTAPYMHDGRFATLAEVIEHYNSGIQQNPNLDDRLTVEGTTGGTPKQYHMTAYEKQALIAFLNTLTDETFVTNPKFSDPFLHH